jgi:catechol 2,3-dioxygenase-like lactoylglutathione lyase family enzyme
MNRTGLDYGAVQIHKLGHSGFWTKDLNESALFYLKNFNFKPSDIMLNSKNEAQLIFCHVDLGKDYSDHHALILGQAFGPIPVGPHHAAFEVDNIDHQFIAHEYLKEKGYKEFWGVGRHIEGSQVFDYWWDVDGFLVEHYADGDIVNEQNTVNWVAPRKKNNNWGPEFPASMGPSVA